MGYTYEDAQWGTHVMVLPSDQYYKKYWNKINWITKNSNGGYNLKEMDLFHGNSNKDRLKGSGKNCPIFFTDAIEGVHFEWIK